MIRKNRQKLVKEELQNNVIKEKNTKKSIRNLILFFILIFITFYIIFKDQNPKEILEIIRNADLKFIFIAIRIYGFIFFM